MNPITTRLVTWSLQTRALVEREYELLRHARRDERGSITIEQVLWAVAIIGLVGIVVTAITAFINKEVGKIK